MRLDIDLTEVSVWVSRYASIILPHFMLHVNSLTLLDVDECSEGTPCDQNALCTNSDGSFDCSCMTGYSGNGTHCLGMLMHLMAH